MKQEKGKGPKSLWIVIAGIVFLAVTTVVVVMLNFGQGGIGWPSWEESISRKLYWNVDGIKYRDAEDTTLSNREPDGDGLYHIRFAVDGEQVEYTLADKNLVNYIDMTDVMGLELDEDGSILEVIPVERFKTELATAFFVQSVEGKTVTLNSSIALNGRKRVITVDDSVEVYDVTAQAEVVGAKDRCQLMDKVTVYADGEENPTHLYITERLPEADIYWRVDRMYSTKEKGTSRKPDENGIYTVLAAKDGIQVELKFRQEHKSLVDLIDEGDRYDGAFAPVLDEEGYVVELMHVAKALRGKYVAASYHITQLDEQGFSCAYKMEGKEQGRTWSGKFHPDCKIYNVNDGGTADMIGEATTLQMGDRVDVFTDGNDNAILIFVLNRQVDSPMYYNVQRSYSKGETTREPVDGYYIFALAVNGKVQTFRTDDKALADKIDSYSYQMFGLDVEDDIIKRVYNPECVTGNFSSGANMYIKDIIGPILTVANGSGSRSENLVMAEDCKVYNVTGVGAEIGAEDTLEMGDQIIAFANAPGELKYIYIINRLTGSPVYWSYDRKYDSKTKETTRVPDEDGYYVFRVAVNGMDTTVKTNSVALATQMDACNPQWFTLELSGNIVKKVFPATFSTGGTVRSSWFSVNSISRGEIVTSSSTGASTTNLVPSEDLKIYNVSSVFDDHWGEQTELRVGDQIHALTDRSSKAVLIYVCQREADSPLYWNKTRMYNTVTKETTREPNTEGYYVFELAVDGGVRQFRTKDREIASQVDSYRVAFGMKIHGDIIKQVYSATSTKAIKGTAASGVDVMSINGNQVYVQQNNPEASDYGKGHRIVLAEDCRFYDACGYVKPFGSAVSLGMGDRIHAFTNNDDAVAVVYILRDNTRQAGAVGFCAHCDAEVLWAPWSGEEFYKADGHYHLTHDITVSKQHSIGTRKGEQVYEIVLDLNGNTLKTDSRGFQIRGGSSFSLMDSVGTGTVSARGSSGNAGNILITDGGKFHLYGGTLTLCDDGVTVKRGGIVYLSGEESEMNQYGGRIVGGKTEFGGGVFMNAGTFHFIEGTITGGCGSTGGNIYMEGGTFNMVGGTINNGESHTMGGNIMVAGEGVLNATGGNITNGVAKYGGNIGVSDNGTASIFGGRLDKGTASLCGGNVFGLGNAKVTVSGSAQITAGVAAASGGNIYISEQDNDESGMLPALKVSGGRIAGGRLQSGNGSNIQTDRGAEIFISGGNIAGDILLGADEDGFAHRITLAGKPVIGRGLNGGLDLGGRTADVSSLDRGADICISTAGAFTGIVKNAEFYIPFFAPYDPAMCVIAKDNTLVCGIAAVCEHCDGQIAVWSSWNGGDFPVVDGHYRLTEDVSISNQITVGSDDGKYSVVIDLNGRTLTADRRAFLVWKGSKLFVTDSVGGGTIAAGGYRDTANAGAALVQSGGEFNLYKGTLRSATEHILADKGGMIHISGAETVVNMYGGTIVGSETAFGGAVCINSGKFNLFDGIVMDGSAGNGGNFYLEGGELNVFGGAIQNGTTTGMGGNICVSKSGKVNISGGTVSRGVAFCGGNVLVYDDGIASVSGTAVIADGTAEDTGGNVYIAPMGGNDRAQPVMVISGGEIYGGRLRNGSGSNIAVNYGGKLTISGGNIAGDVQIGAEDNGIDPPLTLSGSPVIGKGLDRGLDLSGRTIDVAALETNASICISGPCVFTKAMNNPEGCLEIFHAFAEDQKVGVLNGALYCDRYTLCGHCGEKVLWTPWAGGETLPAGHCYLSENAVYTGSAAFQGTADNKLDIVIDLNGKTLTTNTQFYMEHAIISVFDTEGCGVWQSKGTADYGCVAKVMEGSAFHLYGGTLAEHRDHAAYMGGVVYASDDAQFNMYGGQILAGDADALLMEGGTFVMNGGVITGKNTGIEHYVSINNSTNVSIVGTARIDGGILVNDCGMFALSGSPVINKGKRFGLNLPDGKRLTIGELTSGASISITAPGEFASHTNSSVLQTWAEEYFRSDDLTRKVVVDGQCLNFAAAESVVRCPMGHTTHDGGDAQCPAAIVEWKPWADAGNLPTEGNYFLVGDLHIPNATVITGNVQIDLNGCNIINNTRLTGSIPWAKRQLFNITAGGSLGITDLSFNGKGTVSLDSETTCGAGVLAIVGGSMTVYGGILDAGNLLSNAKEAAAVLVRGDASFTMYGGCVKGVAGGQFTYGSTVHVVKNGTANIHGGRLIGGVATRGANIYTEGVLNITGGELVAGALKKYSSETAYGDNIYVGVAAEDDIPAAKLSISGDARINGGIWVETCVSISLSGRPTIKKSGNVTIGLRLPVGIKLDINGLEASAQVGITLAADGVFATHADKAVLKTLCNSFVPDVQTKEIVLWGNDLVLREDHGASRCRL